MYEKYLSEDAIKAAHQQGYKNTSMMEDSWAAWCEALQQLLDEDVKPDEKRAQDLMVNWNQMVNSITGNDVDQTKAFNELFHNEPQARADHGITEEMFEFMGKTVGGH